jgi:hypothetical protein
MSVQYREGKCYGSPSTYTYSNLKNTTNYKCIPDCSCRGIQATYNGEQREYELYDKPILEGTGGNKCQTPCCKCRTCDCASCMK